jgi:hypothetical protein
VAAPTRELVVAQLYGGLWHTTTPDRFEGILRSGAILPEPTIPDRERWATSQGREHYPYVRSLGGVSLFDFDQFDPKAYSKKCSASSWAAFVPYLQHVGSAVWIEIDRARVSAYLISGPDLLAKWNSEGGHGHNIMPYIEAAHLGPLPLTAFRRAFLAREGDEQFHDLMID